MTRWRSPTIAALLRNPAYIGQAAFGKTRVEPRHAPLRPRRGKPEIPRRPYSVTCKDTQPITIAVPALVSEELFAAAQEQLAENKQRYRQTERGARFLLQGLLVCPRCGYAWCGQPRYHGKDSVKPEHPRGSYRCSGRMSQQGSTCDAKPMSTTELDDAVWRDVCQLLREPERIEKEYERRLDKNTDTSPTRQSLAARIAQVKRGIARLIDAYRDGLLEKEEFEPEMRASKERLARLEADERTQAKEEEQRAELRLVIGQLEDFTSRMNEGLEKTDWHTRREIIRALVKQIEVSENEVRIVYRVNTDPFVKAPKGGCAQDCRRRADPFSTSMAASRSIKIRVSHLFSAERSCLGKSGACVGRRPTSRGMLTRRRFRAIAAIPFCGPSARASGLPTRLTPRAGNAAFRSGHTCSCPNTCTF